MHNRDCKVMMLVSIEGPERAKRIPSHSPVSGLTVPKTPNFESTTRSRPVLVPSQKDLEEKEIEEMKKYV